MNFHREHAQLIEVVFVQKFLDLISVLLVFSVRSGPRALSIPAPTEVLVQLIKMEKSFATVLNTLKEISVKFDHLAKTIPVRMEASVSITSVKWELVSIVIARKVMSEISARMKSVL